MSSENTPPLSGEAKARICASLAVRPNEVLGVVPDVSEVGAVRHDPGQVARHFKPQRSVDRSEPLGESQFGAANSKRGTHIPSQD